MRNGTSTGPSTPSCCGRALTLLLLAFPAVCC